MFHTVTPSAVILALLAAAAPAQVVFDNPWDPNATDAGGFSQPSQILAGEFDLAANAGVVQASWRGTMFSQDPLDTGDTWNFDLVFYNDNGGMPGSTFATHAVVADVTDTGVNILDERVYIFDATFPAVALSGGVTYFFSVINAGQSDTFRWNLGTDTSYSGWFTTDGGGTWNDVMDRGPLNFQLLVPAPSTALLLLLGAAAHRRRTR